MILLSWPLKDWDYRALPTLPGSDRKMVLALALGMIAVCVLVLVCCEMGDGVSWGTI